MGATKVFELPTAKACDNAKALAYQYDNVLEDCRFSVSTDYLSKQISITKNPL